MKLTARQRGELDRIATLKLPAIYLANGFPGFPAGNLDMRSVEALEHRGLVECVIYKWKPDGGDYRFTPTYRVTEKGRVTVTSERAVAKLRNFNT